ncbi:MAG TPA: hypothetical protein VM115_06220 [Vicinamibacterales bacterium]|nr:hypothetical protein [Vicinamibacterales bacterium]
MRESKNWNLQSVILGCVLSVCVSGTVHAQQRPLVTEDPETIGSGRILLEGGFSLDTDQAFPASAVEGDVARFASFGVSVGVSPIVELQIDGGLVQRLEVTARPSIPSGRTPPPAIAARTSGVEDFVVATKIRLAPEGPSRPALGLRFGTKLPTAAASNGIGLGTTDFFASLLMAKTVQSVRTVGNIGVIVLGNPETPRDPVTTLGLGVSVARALTNAFEVVGEINGRVSPFEKIVPYGLESRAAMRLAGRYTYSMLRLDLGVLVGFTDRDPSFGISGGATYVITR